MKQKGFVRRSLYFSILDGLFTAMMLGVSEHYLIPYGVALGATAAQTAYLTAVPALVAMLLQTQSARITQWVGSRMKLIRVAVLLHVLAWIPIILIPYALSFTGRRDLAPWVLLAALTLYMAFGAFSVPAWQSLMSDYIPVRKRGDYFGWRNRLQGFLTVFVSVAAGVVLHLSGKGDLTGFTVIFVFAMLCRLYAWLCLRRMAEPFRRSAHDAYFSLRSFVGGMKGSPLSRFVLFTAAMTFAVNVSAPLIPFFLLSDMGFDYVSYMIVTTSASLAGFLFQRIWGRFGDLEGNVKVLRKAGWCVAVIPLFWMFSREPGYLFLVQFAAGAVWGGFNLLVVNFLMEAAPPDRRIRSISYFNVLNGAALFAGSALGGFLFHRLPPLFGYSFLTLFLLSFFLRTTVMFFLGRRMREIRAGGEVSC